MDIDELILDGYIEDADGEWIEESDGSESQF